MLDDNAKQSWGAYAAFLAIVILLGLAIFAGFSRPPLPAPNSQATGQPDNCPQGICPPISSKEANDARLADYTAALAVFTAVLAVVALVQIFFLIRADNTARTTADAAKRSADAAVDSSNAVINQMRAHVSVGTARITGFESDGPIQIEFQITNKGQTPAFDLTCESGVTVREAGANRFKGELWPPDRVPPPLSKSSLAQGDSRSGEMTVTQLRAEHKPAIREGTRAIFLYGEIRYRDAFEKPRYTKFRFMYGGGAPIGDGRFVICEGGNETT